VNNKSFKHQILKDNKYQTLYHNESTLACLNKNEILKKKQEQPHTIKNTVLVPFRLLYWWWI